jgi:hypothetical protein
VVPFFLLESSINDALAWPRGDVLGGSSGINFTQITFPSAEKLTPGGRWETQDGYGRSLYLITVGHRPSPNHLIKHQLG